MTTKRFDADDVLQFSGVWYRVVNRDDCKLCKISMGLKRLTDPVLYTGFMSRYSRSEDLPVVLNVSATLKPAKLLRKLNKNLTGSYLVEHLCDLQLVTTHLYRLKEHTVETTLYGVGSVTLSIDYFIPNTIKLRRQP